MIELDETHQTDDILDNLARRPGIDPILAHLVRKVNKLEIQSVQIWLVASGILITGELVGKLEAFSLVAGHLLEEVPSEIPEEPDSRMIEKSHFEMIATLRNVVALTGKSFSPIPFARVKLSLVGAWGFGTIPMPDQT